MGGTSERNSETAERDASLDGSPGASLDELLKHPELWRAGRLEIHNEALSTGFSNFNAALGGERGDGWPKGGLVELLCDQPGIGELRLLTPVLATLSAEQRWICWINPPHVPYAPALEALGIDVRKILLVHPRGYRDALWALEQSLKMGSCSAVLAWLDDTRVRPADLRRLQLAAKQGRCLAVLFRPERVAVLPSPAELRLKLQAETPPQRDAVRIEILKRRGGWPRKPFTVQLEHLSLTLPELEQRLARWRRYHRRPLSPPSVRQRALR